MTQLGHQKGSVFMGDIKATNLNTLNGIIRSDGDGLLSSSTTLDIDNLSLSNLETDNFKTNVIDTDSTLTSNSDTRLVSQKAIKTFVENSVAADSYRTEVNLHDNTQTDAGSNIVGQTSYNADGIAISNGDRLLLTAETTSAATYLNKIFLVGGVGTSITLTLETDGRSGDGSPFESDTVYVLAGTSNGNQRLTYNGTDWVVSANLSGALVKTLNLSDLVNAATARTNLGLGNVDNTADTAKPISTATQTALDAKADDADVLKKDGSAGLSANWDAGDYKITIDTLECSITTGTSPLTIYSTTKVTNLNADQVDGYDFNQSLQTTNDVQFNDCTLTGVLKESISSTIDVVAANGLTSISDQTLIIQSSTAGDCNITANPQIVAGTAGQHLYLIGNDNTKTVTLEDGDGLSLSTAQSFTLGATDTMHLIYNGSEWVEVTRSNNG
jgi:hypothetical protein